MTRRPAAPRTPGGEVHPAHIAHAVQQGVTPRMARSLPPLTTHTPACGPLWRLFDGEKLEPLVKRQVDALCERCGVRTRCKGGT